jgi:hypothetical protein
MNTSVYSTDDDIITKSLIYKHLNPPYCIIRKFNGNSYLGRVISKVVLLRFNFHRIGIIIQYFYYDINNNIVKYKESYYSETQRKKDIIKNKKEEKRRRCLEKTRSI